MRYREDKPEYLLRAREAVAAWREKHPQGTYEQLVADLGPDFPDGYAPVLRSVLFVIESRGAKILTGVTVIGGGRGPGAGGVRRARPPLAGVARPTPPRCPAAA